jgi:hypothetical protein
MTLQSDNETGLFGDTFLSLSSALQDGITLGILALHSWRSGEEHRTTEHRRLALFFRLTQLPLSSTPRIATIDPSMTTLQFGNWRATQILLAVVERYIVR